MLTDQSYVKSPSMTFKSFYRWTRRYRKDLVPVSTQKKLPKTALRLLFFIRLVSGVLGVRSGSCKGVSYGLHEGGTTAWADATTGWGDTQNKHKKLTSQQSTRSLTTSLHGCFCYRHIRGQCWCSKWPKENGTLLKWNPNLRWNAIGLMDVLDKLEHTVKSQCFPDN